MVSDEVLDRIEQLMGQCDHGPWTASVEGRDHCAGEDVILTGSGPDRGQDIYVTRDDGPAPAHYLDLIALLRTHAPDLIAEVRRSRGAQRPMTDGRPVDIRAARVLALLEDNVRTELLVTSDGFDLGLSDVTIERLTQGVISGLVYAFAVDWSPDWVKAGDVHHWEEAGQFFARCGVCLADSPPSPDEETAAAWAHSHGQSH